MKLFISLVIPNSFSADSECSVFNELLDTGSSPELQKKLTGQQFSFIDSL
jgi:hypothetical protein